MCEYIITIVHICKLVVANTRKSFVSQVASSFGSTFESTFKPLEKELLDWGQLIKKRTAVMVAKSNLTEQSASLHRFNRLQVALSRDSARRQREAQRLHLLTSICSDQPEFDDIWRRERKRGTSTWILKVTPYQSWLQCPVSATMWLQGNLGSGKTFTMASIIGHLSLGDAQSMLRISAVPPTNSQLRTVSYFFCKNANHKTLVAANILGSLAFQVIRYNAIAPLSEHFLDNEDIGRSIGPDFIARLLVQITPRNWKGIFVLDGLDEAPVEEIEELSSHLKVLMEERHVLLCCSSRPTSTCKVVAASFTTINRTLSNGGVDRSEDMRSFISADIERWKLIRPLSPKLENLAIEQLLVGSQGMFLWLSLQLEAICPKYTQELRSDEEILGILNNLPRNLPEAFDQALLRTTDCKYGSRIFQLVAAADPAMSIDELRVAVNVEPGIVAWNSSTLVGSGLRLAAFYGGSLLDIDEEDLCVRFIHHSALLHLLRPPAIASAAPFHFDFQDAEVTFGAVCVTYLNYTVFENRLSTAQKVSFLNVPGVISDSVLGSKKISKRVFTILSREHRISKSGIDLEKLTSNLQSHRFQVNEDIRTFLAYANNNWISATKVFSEGIDQGVYDLWALLVSGNIPSVARSLPWIAE
ncbi:NACHT domain-containing protein [Colletotrichum chrysophilum]|uniref:NACHT domain-containing protein n=1 Tax=Colletotrichum chrysophilum TaxID=1836956 RepID=A0AAD9ARE6_9PEZI|nr:NACHT domain-containing protein [Colletotrichum chrysophilum]